MYVRYKENVKMDLDRGLAVVKLISELGKVEGRKRLQKIVHLLKSKGYKEFNYGFVLHFYGPFSRELANQLDFLCTAGLIEESRLDLAFNYQTPNEDLKHFLQNLLPKTKNMRSWIDFAKELDKKETPFLEALSTIVYLSKAGFEEGELKSKYDRIKPNLKSQFNEAKDYAQQHSLL